MSIFKQPLSQNRHPNQRLEQNEVGSSYEEGGFHRVHHHHEDEHNEHDEDYDNNDNGDDSGDDGGDDD